MNYKIVVDAGHGGTDPGAIGNGIVEKDYSLMISQYMKERFEELGVPVSLTRETDVTLSPVERVERAKSFYGNGNDVILISNQLNAGGGDGFEVFYALRNNDTLSKLITEEIAKEGQNIRGYFQRRLPGDPSKDYYFILRDTANMESLLVEYGFLDSTKDDVQQIRNNWQDYAEAVVKSVMQYIKKPYMPPITGENPEFYTVVSGDSLWSIANKFGVSVDELKAVNNLTSNLLSVGQLLRIPERNPSGNQEGIYYAVVKGDTLYGIASRYGIDVNSIINANNLSSTTLSVGQELFIPGVVSEPGDDEEVVHTVVSGDTLYSIANKYGVSVQDIMGANNLTGTTLSLGQKLVILQNGDSNNEIPPVDNIRYAVKSGDSLWRIAQRYGTTVSEIKRLNNLSSDTLSVGQILLIPNTESYLTYTVRSGDNLYNIAQEFNITVNSIIRLNNLSSTALSVGQKLLIPQKSY